MSTPNNADRSTRPGHRGRRGLLAAVALVTATAGLSGLGTVAAAGSPPPAPPASTTAADRASAAARAAAGLTSARLPKGWTRTSGAGTDRLAWRAPRTTMGDSRVQFFSGDRLLGTPRAAADGRSYRLDVPAGTSGNPSGLQVVAGGRRIDAAGQATMAASHPLDPDLAPAPSATTTPDPSLTSSPDPSGTVSPDPSATSSQDPEPDPAPPLPLAPVDPGRVGTFQTITGEYSLPDVQLPGMAVPVEMKAVVVAPRGATGVRPLVLLLHGRHEVCYGGKDDDTEQSWPCPAGTQPIPSYLGYLRAQKLLASQGYDTVSISANGINAQDGDVEDGGAQARSSLVRLHLAHWADWSSGAGRASAPAIVQQAPPADLDRVLLMGHSRGGEGVNRAAIDSLNPPPADVDGYHGPVRWTIRGTVQLAPTMFGHDPAADVPSVVVLPGCDGDVFDLQGQMTVDGTRGVGSGTALHSAVFVVGADHNYFNSEWTPGLSAAPSSDDWWDPDDAVCGTDSPTSQRLTPVQEQQVGATYIAAAAQLFLKHDDRVLPLLDGSGVWVTSVSPARVLSHAVGAGRAPFVQPAEGMSVTGSPATDARLCRETAIDESGCLPADSVTTVPSFDSFSGITDDPDRYAADLSWTAPGGNGARLKPRHAVSLAGSQAVSLRMIVPSGSGTSTFGVAVTDADGDSATLGQVSLTGLPGTDETVGSWAQEVRVPLAAAREAGLDLRKIAALQLIPETGSGQAYLLDAWGWRPDTPAVRVTSMARIDVGGLAPVSETDSTVSYRMPVSVSGNGSGTVRIFTEDYAAGTGSNQLVTVTPGMDHIDVPLTVAGDNEYGYGGFQVVLARAVHGTVVGDYQGSLEVDEDDPLPTVAATPLWNRVLEGGTLSWKLTLSAPAAVDLFAPLTILAPASGAELSTTDVTADWMANTLFADPLPSRPLSESGGYAYVQFAAGDTQAEVHVPSVADDLDEPGESVRIEVGSFDGSPTTVPDLTGTVVDNP